MVDLFAGTGAFTLAFLATGRVEVVFANDMVPESKKIYDENFGHALTLKNLLDIPVEDIPRHDILTGGFPCQPFSIAGRQEGFNDPRSNVFWKILEILKHHRPLYIVLENVKNLTSHDEGRTFKVIRENLEGLGYRLKFQVLDTSKVTGIPHHRERIYIVGVLDHDNHLDLDFPEVPKYELHEFLDKQVPDKYYYSDRMQVWDKVQEGVVKHIREGAMYQYRRVYVRENKSGDCPTLTANAGGGGHNVPLLKDDRGIRKLTPRECFRLQGFPDEYKFPKMSDSALYKLAGNAVSVPLVKMIADRLLD